VSATAGLAIGIGYAASHVVEGDLGAIAIGAITAAAWLAVLALSCYRTLAHTSWVRKVIALALGLVTLQLVVLPIAAGTAGAHGPRMALTTERPAGAAEIILRTFDGADLHGWYTPGTNGAAVIVLPAADGNRGLTVGHASVLAANGFSVLAVDARGSGDSTGYANLWGWDGSADISVAINWLEEQANVGPRSIGLVGLSMGGEQSVTAVPVDHRIHAVVAEGVQARVPADAWYVGSDPRAMVERATSTVMWTVANLWTNLSQPPPLRDVVASIKSTPVLIVAADAPDERAVAADLASISPVVEIWQTSGISHTQALAMAPREWETRVVDFLRSHLLED
jgi:hypothetical protein